MCELCLTCRVDSARRAVRQHGTQPEEDEPPLDEGREMRIRHAGRAPADQGCGSELSIGRGGRAGQGAKDEKQESRKPDQALLAENLEKLVVWIARVVSPPPGDALAIGAISVREAAGADPEDRVVADHSQRGRPKDGAIAERSRRRRL